MATLVKKVELNWLDRTYVWPVLMGMVITMRHFIKQITTRSSRRFTIPYPDRKREPAPEKVKAISNPSKAKTAPSAVPMPLAKPSGSPTNQWFSSKIESAA